MRNDGWPISARTGTKCNVWGSFPLNMFLCVGVGAQIDVDVGDVAVSDSVALIVSV